MQVMLLVTTVAANIYFNKCRDLHSLVPCLRALTCLRISKDISLLVPKPVSTLYHGVSISLWFGLGCW